MDCKAHSLNLWLKLYVLLWLGGFEGVIYFHNLNLIVLKVAFAKFYIVLIIYLTCTIMQSSKINILCLEIYKHYSIYIHTFFLHTYIHLLLFPKTAF